MSLNKTIIPVTFDGGVDTKTATKLVKNGFFLDLQNVVRTKTGQLSKRFGFTALGKTVFGTSTAISTGQRLSTFRNDLLLIDNTNLYSYSTANDAWSQRGQVISALVTSTPIIRTSVKQAMPDMISYKGISVTVWEDSRGGVRCTVVDDSTDSPITADQLVSASGSRPKVIAFNDTFLITYYDSGSWKCRRIAFVQPTTLIAEQTISADITDNPYDLVVYGSVAVYAYNTATTIKLGYLTSAGTNGSPGTNGFPAPVTIAARAQNGLTLVTDTARAFHYIFYHGTTTGNVTVSAYTTDLNTVYTSSVETIANIRNITAVLRSDASVRVFYEQSAASVKNYLVKQNTLTFSGTALTIGTPTVFKKSVGLAAKAFAVGTLEYVTVVHESTLQSTYFTVKQDGFIVTRMQSSFASGLTRDTAGSLKGGLQRVSVDQNGSYVFPVTVKNKLTTETSTVQSTFVGVNKQSLAFSTSTFNTDTIGENYLIAGGVMLTYDGISTVEHGFHVYPEDITATAVGTGGSVTANSNCRVTAVYEWVDGQGQIHQSATTIAPPSITIVGSGSITVVVPTLRLTEKTGTRADARIVVYRTIANDTTVYYRDVDAANNPAADTVTVTLTQADTTLATQQILYTVGGELDNIAPPSCQALHKHKNRMFLFGLEDQYAVEYSKQSDYGTGAGFSDGFRIRVDPRGGPCRAGSTLDDKLVIFKDTAIFIQVGDGPLLTGAQNDYQDPQLISSDVGCSNPRSIVICDKGIMFQSHKGIYLLDRSGQTPYIGAPVDSFNNLTITSATLLSDQNEVRFTTKEGVCLVYNTLYNQWSTFTNYASQDGVVFLNKYLHLTSSGTVNAEIQDQYNDNGQTYSQRIETSWFNLGKVQGFQRIYRWALLGDFLSHCIARINIAYDYEDTYTETVYFRTQTGLGTDTYGADALYGDSVVFGGSGSTVFQCRSKPTRQKCQSIKLLIEDLDTVSASGGGSFSLVSLAFEVGQKTGINKLNGVKTVGS
jgi:hypothetical protein